MIFIPLNKLLIQDYTHCSIILNIHPSLMKSTVLEVSGYLSGSIPYQFFEGYSFNLLKLLSVIYHLWRHIDARRRGLEMEHLSINFYIEWTKWHSPKNQDKPALDEVMMAVVFHQVSQLYLLYTESDPGLRIKLPTDEVEILIDDWIDYLDNKLPEMHSNF